VSEFRADDRPQRFATTHWTVVANAGAVGSPESRSALAELCQRYWYPLYCYVRRRGYQTAEAQDLTQQFFAALLESNLVARASAERGRFRTFLLASLDHFLANEWDKQNRLKRGGGHQILSIDWQAGESRWGNEPTTHDTPERQFLRQWAVTLLNRVIEELRGEYTASDKSRHFDLFEPTLIGHEHGDSYARIATELKLSADAVRQAASRFRRRYRDLLRQEIEQTVCNSGEIDEEIRSLFNDLSS